MLENPLIDIFPDVTINNAAQIPVLPRGDSKRIRLLCADNEDLYHLKDQIDFCDTGHHVLRKDDFPFEVLHDFLPRMAQKTVSPELVELIPATSWFASLANLLVGSSWKALRDFAISRTRCCEECGSALNLEAHEIWEYDHEDLVQTLTGIEVLCNLCHGTRHLGRANIIGNFDATFKRLCLINRLTVEQENPYKDMIFGLWEERSSKQWKINLSEVLGDDMCLKLKGSVEYAGDNWLVQPKTASRDEAAVEIIGADIASDGLRIVLLKEGTGPQQ